LYDKLNKIPKTAPKIVKKRMNSSRTARGVGGVQKEQFSPRPQLRGPPNKDKVKYA
jgi:hypothetical protein